MVLALARPSEAWCFPPGADFFEAVLLLAAAGLDGVFPSGNCILECVSVGEYCFSRISDDTLGSFLARFSH